MVMVLAVLVVGGLAWLVQRNRAAGKAGRGTAVSREAARGAAQAGMPAEMYGCEQLPAGRRPLGRVVVEGLTKEYRGVVVVDSASFTAEPGRVTGFLGPNGAGKTTTLRMLLGLVEPTRGTARIGPDRYADIEEPARRVGAVLEASGTHEGRTGRDHLRVLCRTAGLPLARADEVLDVVGLSAAASRRAGEYSLGMRQRLGVAAALLGDPQVLILDEPGNGLDPAGVRWIREFLRQLAASGRTVLVSSHQLAEIGQLADDLVIIAAGRVVAAGTVGSVTGDHASLEDAFLELTEGKDEIR